jgi:hypothetical protein
MLILRLRAAQDSEVHRSQVSSLPWRSWCSSCSLVYQTSDVVKKSTLLSCVRRCGPAAAQLGVVSWARFVGSDSRVPG